MQVVYSIFLQSLLFGKRELTKQRERKREREPFGFLWRMIVLEFIGCARVNQFTSSVTLYVCVCV